MHRRVQPLQKQAHPGFLYQSPSNPSYFSAENLGGYDLLKQVCRVLDEVEKVLFVPKGLFNVKHRPEEEGVS